MQGMELSRIDIWRLRLWVRGWQLAEAVLPRLAPLVARLGAERASRWLRWPEQVFKHLAFSCQECGQCVLHYIGMTCPMTCPKQLRNGPCGGVRADGHCEVYPERPCVWLLAFARAAYTPYTGELRRLNPPVDWRLQGESSWVTYITGRDQVVTGHQAPPCYVGTPPPPLTSDSPLERVLQAGHFAVACEVSPPVGPNLEAIQRHIDVLRGYADVYNVTDNQGAAVHFSPLVTAILLKQAGLEPVLQLTCRDRNRLALQSDLLGAAGMGINTVLALSGDHLRSGDHPQAKPVYDLDAVNLVRMIRMMNEGVFENGKPIPRRAPRFFIGAAENPNAPPEEARLLRLAKKATAGARFIQTQLIYNVPRFRTFMERVVEAGLHEQVAILAGVGPIRSLRAAEFMAREVPGLDVPDWIIERIGRYSKKEDQARVGLEIGIELAQELRTIPGVRGLHVMAVSWPEAVPPLVQALGLYPRPRLEPVEWRSLSALSLADVEAWPLEEL